MSQIEHRIIASALDACRAAERRCADLGYRALLLSHMVEGEAREVGIVHAGLAWGALTDGIDGPTRAAGGLVDGLSARRAREGGVDVRAALARNDSHAALEAMDDLIVTGATGTNVADLRVVLVAG